MLYVHNIARDYVCEDETLVAAAHDAVWRLRLRHRVRTDDDRVYDDWERETAWRVQDVEADLGVRLDVYDTAWRVMWELHREGRLEVTA